MTKVMRLKRNAKARKWEWIELSGDAAERELEKFHNSKLKFGIGEKIDGKLYLVPNPEGFIIGLMLEIAWRLYTLSEIIREAAFRTHEGVIEYLMRESA
jgi:hypothetical protein